MKRVTQRIKPAAARHLLERAPRAHAAFVHGGRLEAAPVLFRFHEGRYWIGVPSRTARPQGKVALTIDEGWYWFELRAVCIRGVATPAPPPAGGAAAGIDWFEVVPSCVTAWDYETLHEEDVDAAR